MKSGGLALLFALCCSAADKPTLIVTAVIGEHQIQEGVWSRTVPGKTNTSCAPGIWGSVNCQSTNTPAQTINVPVQRLDVRNLVDGDDGTRYTILCSTTSSRNHCFPMERPHEQFGAKVDGKTMWVYAQLGGNMGKKVKIKFTIIDERPIPPQ